MTYQNQAALLLKAREQQKCTQKEMAKKIHMSVQFISNIERGIAGIPTKYVNHLQKVGVPKKELYNAIVDDFILSVTKEIFG